MESDDVAYSAIRDAYVSELAAGELRAKRSLRALQHQEGRISTLENELCGKSSMLQQLQESHSDLIEAHCYQREVQDLQKQLIRLQEIQYLTEYTKPTTVDNDDDDAKECLSSPNLETFSESDDVNNNGNFNSPNSSQTALFKSFRKVEGGRGVVDSVTTMDNKNEETEKSAIDNAMMSEPEYSRMKKSCSLKSRLGSMGGLLLQEESRKMNFDESQTAEKYGGDQGRFNYFARRGKIGATEDENSFRMHSRQMPTTFDDDDDKLSILKEALSSHKQSIEDLSTEVVLLRKEKSELLSYVQTLLEWKSKVENRLEASGETKDASFAKFQEKDAFSKDEINVIMSASERSYNASSNDSVSLDKNRSKHVQLNIRRGSDSSTMMNSTESRNIFAKDEEPGTKLEMRARRLWETACRFFTPEQAHFILTAPITDEEDGYSTSTLEDN